MTAPLAVIPDPGAEATASSDAKTLAVLDTALLANQEQVLLSSYRIELAEDSAGIINFIASASDPLKAASRAEGMRTLLEDTIKNQQSEQDKRIAAQQIVIRDRLEEIEQAIAEFESERAPTDLEGVVALELEQAELSAIQTELNALYVENTTGADTTVDPLRTLDDVDREIKALETAYADKRLEILANTQVAGNLEFNPVDREISLLVDEYNARIQEYGSLVLSVASADVQPLGSPEVLDITATPGSAATNGAAGLLGGVLLALGAVIVHDRIRQIVWVGSDMATVPYLGEVVQRAAPVIAGQAWYEFGGPTQRKRSIQSIRVTVEGASESGSALGFMGVAGGADVHDFAADFAMSMVTSGSRVLLIDADFESPSVLFEFTGSGASLSDLLQFRLEDEESYRAFIKRSLTEPAEITAGLAAVQSRPWAGRPRQTPWPDARCRSSSKRFGVSTTSLSSWQDRAPTRPPWQP